MRFMPHQQKEKDTAGLLATLSRISPKAVKKTMGIDIAADLFEN